MKRGGKSKKLFVVKLHLGLEDLTQARISKRKKVTASIKALYLGFHVRCSGGSGGGGEGRGIKKKMTSKVVRL